jgi:hypothetical protein
MKLQLQKHWRDGRAPGVYDVADAVVEQIEHSARMGSTREGALESVDTKVDEALRLVGRLVAQLHAAGALPDEGVLALLDSFEEAPK